MLVAGVFVTTMGARKAPPIHDVSTDTQDPPRLSRAAALARAKIKGNSTEFVGKPIPAGLPFAGKLPAEAQRAAYPDIKTHTTALPPVDLFDIVLDAARAQKWRIVTSDPAKGRIDAEAASFWYGVTDDIVVRVRPLPDGSGSAVDVRSCARIGDGDMGANANHVRRFLADLDARLANATTG
jgi:uncharacterized protein (DUF1499 family)